MCCKIVVVINQWLDQPETHVLRRSPCLALPRVPDQRVKIVQRPSLEWTQQAKNKSIKLCLAIFCYIHRLESSPIVIGETSSSNGWKWMQRPTVLSCFSVQVESRISKDKDFLCIFRSEYYIFSVFSQYLLFSFVNNYRIFLLWMITEFSAWKFRLPCWQFSNCP